MGKGDQCCLGGRRNLKAQRALGTDKATIGVVTIDGEAGKSLPAGSARMAVGAEVLRMRRKCRRPMPILRLRCFGAADPAQNGDEPWRGLNKRGSLPRAIAEPFSQRSVSALSVGSSRRPRSSVIQGDGGGTGALLTPAWMASGVMPRGPCSSSAVAMGASEA